MGADQLRIVFWIDAILSAGVGLLLLAGTWDGLYDALDLPRARPAMFVQLGVSDLARGRAHAHSLLRVQDLHVELDRGVGAVHDQIRGDLRIAVRNWLHVRH